MSGPSSVELQGSAVSNKVLFIIMELTATADTTNTTQERTTQEKGAQKRGFKVQPIFCQVIMTT